MSKKAYILKQPIRTGTHYRFCSTLQELSEKLTSLDATVLIVDDGDYVQRDDIEGFLNFVNQEAGVPIRELLNMN